VPLTRRPRSPRHAAPRSFRPAAVLPAVLALAVTGALAGLATTSNAASGPQTVAASTEDVAVLAANRSPVLRASRNRSDVVLPAESAPALEVPAPAEPVAEPPPPPPPAAARPSDGLLTSSFGPRWGRLHAGLDFATGIGAPVRAAADGTVAATGIEGGYGLTVRVHHADGAETLYAHLSSIEVWPGQPVAVGQDIAREGNTGRSTGPHLHFEVRYPHGPVDPAVWLMERGVGV
jgi:murein DD-endopeptidase MepM/ murein hydrolase activator NlpD